MNINGKIFNSSAVRMLLDSSGWRLFSNIFHAQASGSNSNNDLWSASHADSHAHREILIVLNGECECRLGSNTYRARPGDVFMFDAYELHNAGYPPGVHGIEHLWLIWLGNKIIARLARPSLTGKTRREIIFENAVLTDWLTTVWDRIKQQINYPEMLKTELFKSALSMVVTEIVIQDIYGEVDSETSSKYREKIINMIRQHIDSTAGRGLTIDKLAKLSRYSKFHFIKLFKQHTGENVLHYINNARIRKVREMEKDGFLKKEISEALGFSCPSAFTHWYHRNIR